MNAPNRRDVGGVRCDAAKSIAENATPDLEVVKAVARRAGGELYRNGVGIGCGLWRIPGERQFADFPAMGVIRFEGKDRSVGSELLDGGRGARLSEDPPAG